MRSLAVLASAGLVFIAAGCQHEAAPPPPSSAHVKPKQFRTAVVEMREFPLDEIVAPGKVEVNPNRVSKVLMPLAGRIRRLLVRLGDSVTEGQSLAVVESPEAGAALAAQAQAQAQVRQAATTLARAEKDLSRVRELNANKAAPFKEVVSAETEVELAKAALVQAQTAADESVHRLGMLGLDPAKHTHEISVPAPISGKVLEVSVAPGELRNDTNQPLMTIADLSTVWVTSQVPESSIRLILINELVEIELLAYPNEVFRGRVRRIADTVDADTRTVRVQVELENRRGRLRPEMFGRIRHSHGTQRNPGVPSSAVLHSGGDTWLMVERAPGSVEKRAVETGEAANGVIPILKGVSAGERVVVDGAALLRQQ